jgi:hypothetical protein
MKDIAKSDIRHIGKGFYFKKLNYWQIILFASIFITELILFISDKILNGRDLPTLKVILLVIIWWIPLVSGIANIFRNVYSFILWFLACFIWIFIDFIPNFSFIPIITFICIILMRFLFKIIFNREPIFVVLSRFKFSFYDKIEKRNSTIQDFVFSMLILLMGLAILILISKI